MTDPFVVVGGDAAGLSAASKYRRENPDRPVVVFEKGRWVSYAHCGMPYYVKGEVQHLESLLSLSPEEIDDRGIDLRRSHEVVDLDTTAQVVTVDQDGTRFDQPYEDLLIATGARAVTTPIPGTDRKGVFTMHAMDAAAALRAYLTPSDAIDVDAVDGPYVDRDYVREYANRDPPETAAIVGGGYVGVEMAEAFTAHDLDIHLFQRGDRPLPPFGQAVGDQVAETLRENDVTLHLGTTVETLRGDDWVAAVETGGESIAADVVLVGIGIAPNTGFLEDSLVTLEDQGAVVTDDYGKTTVDQVYAAGDCAQVTHTVTGDETWMPLGLTANRAGRAVGATVAGTPTPVGSVAETAVVKAFDQECGRTGIIDHDRARDNGFDPVSETITARSRSGYYPGAAPTTVTLTADRTTGRLLGGAIVGTDRAAIRIDTIATALESDLTVPQLERLDLAYAPPFSPVWDPVLVAGKVLSGTLSES